MKYRKKPVVVEAFQIKPHGGVPAWFMDAVKAGDARPHPGQEDSIMRADRPCIVRTLHGEVEAMPGDWIVKGPQGDIYPVKPDTFEMTFERISKWADKMAEQGVTNEWRTAEDITNG